MKIIPYGRQYIDNDDIKLVSKALKENLITTGKYVKKFENKIEKFLKVKYAVSCNSGTSALHLAFMAINLKKNDVIIMPAINFIAAYNMANLMKAKIFLADVDSCTGQMTPKTLLECIKILFFKNKNFRNDCKSEMTLVIMRVGHVVGLSFTIIFKKLYPAFCSNMMMLQKKINELKNLCRF
jgi:dTDP-4-amino-4,6-dideoxygalactose transaminase